MRVKGSAERAVAAFRHHLESQVALYHFVARPDGSCVRSRAKRAYLAHKLRLATEFLRRSENISVERIPFGGLVAKHSME